jgi:hypothetical protein
VRVFLSDDLFQLSLNRVLKIEGKNISLPNNKPTAHQLNILPEVPADHLGLINPIKIDVQLDPLFFLNDPLGEVAFVHKSLDQVRLELHVKRLLLTGEHPPELHIATRSELHGPAEGRVLALEQGLGAEGEVGLEQRLLQALQTRLLKR